MTMRSAIWLGLSALFMGCGTDDLIKNPDVDVWCGDRPCGWDFDGDIERVGTWHSHDFAVSFESAGTRLHQLNEDVSDATECISFSMIAKVEEGAKGYVALDFLDDGHIDWQKPIPVADFEAFTFYVTPPSRFERLRFIVGKEGEGGMVLAKLRARDDVESYEKCTAPAVELEDLQGGVACSEHAQCAFGACLGGACAGCDGDDDCPSGWACGYSSSRGTGDEDYGARTVIPMCVARASRPLGALCLGDSECETGICCEGVCSECCGEGSCGAEVACEPSVAAVDGADYALPHQCAPGENRAHLGKACTADEDCASGSCGHRECTGLCSWYYEDLFDKPDCAKSDCEEPECRAPRCAVQTLEVGVCN